MALILYQPKYYAMNTPIETPKLKTFIPSIERPRQRYISIEQLMVYLLENYGLKISKATIYKKRSQGTFIGMRSPFGKICFDPDEVDRYMTAQLSTEQENGKE